MNATFRSASCSGQNCVAAGRYNNGTYYYPLLANSMNGGRSWTYSLDANAPDLPAGTVHAQFASASCSGQNCVAAGYYNNGTHNYPLLANSTNGGISWIYSIDASTPTLPTGASQAQFGSASVSTSSLLPASLRSLIDPLDVRRPPSQRYK